MRGGAESSYRGAVPELNRLTFRTSLERVLALACLVAATACSSSPTAPPADPGAPTLACPASIAQLSSLGIPLALSFSLPTVTGGAAPISGPVCTPPPGSTFNRGATTVNCTATDAKNRAGTCSFTVTVTYPPKLSVTKFIAFGDSITYGEDGQYAVTASVQQLLIRPHVQLAYPDTYPGALQILLVGRYTLQSPIVFSDGYPGQNLLDPMTLPDFKRDIVGYDSVLIMMGSNDLRQQDSVLEPGMIAQYGSMIDFARSMNIKPVLATLPPMNPAGCCPIDRAQGWQLVAPFDDQIRSFATSKNVPLADVFNAFNGDLTLIGPDGLHPDAAGYHVIAQTFFKTIENSFEVATASTTTSSRTLSPARRSR